MKLTINNIGIINNANIDIDGITVIVGENGTGKSTIGKTLFCLFDSLFEADNKIENERRRTIEQRLLQYTPVDIMSRPGVKRLIRELSKALVELSHDRLSREAIAEKLQSNNLIRKSDETDLEQLIDKITDILEISDEDIQNRIMQKSLEVEFAEKILNVNSESKKGSFSIHMKDGDVQVDLCDNRASVISNVAINKQVIYIDDPYIVDMPFSINRFGGYGHRIRLEDKLTKRTDKTTAIDEILYDKKMSTVMDCMNAACPGKLEVNNIGELGYAADNLREPLKMVNLSTGLKSFMIIKALLEKGEIEENGIIILDEPEVHLHPEWQMKYAEMIVLLQKIFNMNFLISTHSPDFLTAVEMYSKRNHLSTNRYYYIKKEQNQLYSDIEEVTDNIDIIYRSLSEPMVNMSRELDYEI